MASSDSALLTRWREGDAGAGKQLFEGYFDPLRRFFANKVSEGIDDLIQETFLRCLRSPDRIDDGGKFRSYLFSIAHRVFIDHLRHRHRNSDPIDYAEVSLQDLSPNARSLIIRHEEQRLLLGALRHLPIASQVLLELHYWESLSVAEIAQVFYVPTPTVQGRLRRARRLLDEALGRLAESPELLASTVDRFETWIEDCRDICANPVMGGPITRFPNEVRRHEPNHPRTTVFLTIEGDIEQLTSQRRREFEEYLRRQLGDPSIKIRSVRSGSIILELDVGLETALILKKMVDAGDTTSICGMQIISLTIKEASDDPASTMKSNGARIGSLSDLLSALFCVDELRRFMTKYSQNGQNLATKLPEGNPSLENVAFRAACLLDRYGLVDRHLFLSLREERPGRASDIVIVEQECLPEIIIDVALK